MLKPTKFHEDAIDAKKRRYSIRIGSKVPNNAVNLAYYYNKKASSNQSLLVAESAKNIIDHKYVERWITKGPLQTKDEKVFPMNIPYHDNDGYSGPLYRRFINWEDTAHVEKKTNTDTGTITGLKDDFSEPIDRKYFQDGLYGGLEYLMNVKYTPTRFKSVTEPGTQYKECTSEETVTQDSQSNNFPETISYNSDGFSGSLHKNGSVIVDTIFTNVGGGSPKQIKKELSGLPSKENNYPPRQIIEGGTTWILTDINSGKKQGDPVTQTFEVSSEPAPGDTKTITDENGVNITLTYVPGSYSSIKTSTELKGYGISIYWSSSKCMSDPCGDYGGHWNEDPKLMYSRYGHDANIRSDNDIRDDGCWYDNDGSLWWYDSSVSGKSIMWVDDWNKSIPPPGYDKDDNDSNNKPYFIKGGGAPVWDATGFQHSTKGPQHWKRYTLAFYKGKKTTSKSTAQYAGKKPDVYGIVAIYEAESTGSTETSYKLTQRYNNVLSKDDSKTIQVPSQYTADINYKGVLQYTWYDYTGAAFYDGSVIKRGAIDNINPVGSNLITMYPDDAGVLHDEYGKKELASENVDITNLYKDNVPLFYRGKLKYKIYDSVGPNNLGIYTGTSIKLVNPNMMTLNAKKYKYIVKLIPVDPTGLNIDLKDLYEAYIYTSFQITSNFKVNCVYNAYDDKPGLSTLERLKPGLIEQLSVQPFFEKNIDYNMTVADAIGRKNIFTLANNPVITDSRNKIEFNFRVKTADNEFVSTTMNAFAINKDYAFPDEKVLFQDRNYNVSPIQSGNHMNAYEIIMRDCKSQLVDIHGNYDEGRLNRLKNKIFVVEFVNVGSIADKNRNLVNLYTPQDGMGIISVETTEDTGFKDENGGYTKKISLPGKYKVANNKIYPAYELMCKDAKLITVKPPNSIETLENWYPRVAFSHFERVYTVHGMAVKLNYAMPEYDRQDYSSVYGKPYMDVINEKAVVINETTIKIKNSPMYVKLDNNYKPINLTVTKKDITGSTKNLKISNWIYTDGLIELKDIISENDTIFVTYTYEELNYVYRGFYDKGSTFIDLDVNPSKYHTFLDNRLKPYERRHVYDLFNTVIYFFLRPSRISQIYQDTIENITPPVTMVPEIINTETIYHKFGDSMPDSKYDIAIGNIHIRQNTSLKSTVMIDTRTRGGGVIEGLSDQLRRELEPESDYYWDIGYWDGEPYTENAVIVIRLDRRILKTYGGRFTPQEVEKSVSKWISAGVMPIIEYVTTFTKEELPQGSLTISYEHTNKLEYTPTMFISTVEV